MERKTMAAADMSRELLHSCKNDPDLRLKKSAFTMQRKLGAERVLHMLHRLAGPLQLELDAYCEFLEEAPVSKQAFSKVRVNLNPAAYVRKFADALAGLHAQDSDAPTWYGMRLIAIDGADIALENSVELKRVFGCSEPKWDAATTSGSLPTGRWITRSMTVRLCLTPPMSGICQSCIWPDSWSSG